MNIQTSQAIFLIGLAWYLATRAVYQRRAAGNETTVKRSSIVDRLLVVLVVFGQIIIPLIYVLSPLLNFANYEQMPSLIPLGTFAWAAGMWVFWRSHADLGKNWSVSLELHSGHRLVTHVNLPHPPASHVCVVPSVWRRPSTTPSQLASGPFCTGCGSAHVHRPSASRRSNDV